MPGIAFALDWMNVFAPVHEIGHILAGKLTGVHTWMTGCSTTSAEGSISFFFVMFGETFEIIVFGAVAIIACIRRRYGIGSFAWGIMLIDLVFIPIQDDYDFIEKY